MIQIKIDTLLNPAVTWLTVPQSGVNGIGIATESKIIAVAFYSHLSMEVTKMKFLKTLVLSIALILSVTSIAVVPAVSCPYSDGKKVEDPTT